MIKDYSGSEKGTGLLISSNLEPFNKSVPFFAWVYLEPGVWLSIDVYQQYLSFLPAVHDVIYSTMQGAKRN